jgi:hypothetical protein
MVVRYCVYARKEGSQEKGSLVEDFLSREEAETFAGLESCQMESEGYELYVLERNMQERKTETRAQELVKAMKQSGDMITFVIESCKSAAAFSMYGEYNRSLFTRELQRQLEIFNKENGVTARSGATPGVRFISKEYDEEIKCPGCNWGTMTLFMLETQSDNFEQDGLCGQCCMETIVAEQIRIPCDELNVPAEIVEGQFAEMCTVKTEEAGACK